MLPLTLSLVLASGLGLLFESTRWEGLLGAAALCFLHPAFVLLSLAAAGLGYLFINRRRLNDEL